MNATYRTIIVKFKKTITELDGIFSDMQFWGVATLKEWIDGSTRFTQTDSHIAIIPSEYSMEYVRDVALCVNGKNKLCITNNKHQS